jgi:hypothetical protein
MELDTLILGNIFLQAIIRELLIVKSMYIIQCQASICVVVLNKEERKLYRNSKS